RWAASASAHLAAVPPYAPVEAKRAAWDDDARAVSAEASSRAARTRAVQLLRAALSHVPDWPAAHALLADLFHAQHQALERARRPADAEAVAADLREHDRAGRFRRYLTGTGAVTLHTDVPVEVVLHRLVERDRRWVPERERSLGPTPLDRVPLEMGSWLLTLHRDDHEVVTYPVWLGRGEHWHGVRPGDTAPHPVWIPPRGALVPGEVYVPAGWFWSGEEEFEHTLPLRRIWVDGFAIDRFPATVGTYVGYLNAMVDAGDGPGALAAMPRLGDADEPLFARDAAGRFVGIRQDRHGAGWDLVPTDPETPVTNLDWHQAVGFARWAGRRLPVELEWQKAARGADLRRYPWGDRFEPSYCRMVLSAPQSMIVPVSDHPTDVSPYGVRGMAGNVSDWVLDGIPALPDQETSDIALVRVSDAPQRLVTGGSCGAGPRTCEVTQRSRISATSRGMKIGFRTARAIG
ncbi:MAG: SUMF1/EgtB/PvdO family nonheme iron enzyme, partial [Myxococcota bacterium]